MRNGKKDNVLFSLSALALAVSLQVGGSLIPGGADSPYAAIARHRHSGGASRGSAHTHHAAEAASHHGRHHGHSVKAASAPKPRYAYSYDIFMMNPPEFDKSPLPEDLAQRVRESFRTGTADNYPPNYLVRSGITKFHALRGGLYNRRERVKYIIVHSTETGVPQDAPHVIESWSSGGRRHPGAQYVIDRDGTIYQTTDPDVATVHVNIFKTLPGINNDNSIGIEMVHAGRQDYPAELRESAKRLVAYLQERYHVLDGNVITHRYAQQGDHTDPVAFDFEAFLNTKDVFRQQALAMRSSRDGDDILEEDIPVASVYIQMHQALKAEDVLRRRTVVVPASSFAPANSTAPTSTIIIAPANPTAPARTTIITPATGNAPGTTTVITPATHTAPGSTFAPADTYRPSSTFAPATNTQPANPFAPANKSAPSSTFASPGKQEPMRSFVQPPPQKPSTLAATGSHVPLRGEIEVPPGTADQLRNDEKLLPSLSRPNWKSPPPAFKQ